jgi:hypothetical protein
MTVGTMTAAAMIPAMAPDDKPEPGLVVVLDEHSHGPYVGAAKGHTAPVSRARQLMFFSQ